MNYYERHVGDYIKDTVSLTMVEDGAYNRLIDQCYQSEKPLPLDVKEVYREARANTPAERKAVDYVLGKFFEKTAGGYIQKRVEAEIARYQEKQRKAKASADARWNKPKPDSEGNANASKTQDASDMRTHSVGNAHQTPDTSPQVGIPGATAPLPPASPAAPQPADPELPGLDLEAHVAGMPPCPAKQLVLLFVAKVPTLPKPRYEMWKDSAGADAMRQRWKWLLGPDAVREDGSRYATTAAEAVDWFGRFFDTVNESDFLTGRSGNWRNCDLAWLMKRENFMKVVQGNYTNKERP